jgi:integrase
MRGNITRRGRNSWRLKFDVGVDCAGKRQIRYITVRGKRQDAQRELTKLLGQADAGTLPEPNKSTVKEYIQAWLGASPAPGQPQPPPPHGLTPKTVDRYRQLAEQQIYPHLGGILLQKLRPAQVQEWHSTLLKAGNRKGRAKGGPLAARTVGHAHRVLHRALERAVENETLARNVASVIAPPKVEDQEVEILGAEDLATVLRKLENHALYSVVAVGLATGLRRGELLALPWANVDLDGASLRVERSLEETKAGLRFKAPKTVHGRRTISLPPNAVAVLREHRRKQLELRLALGLGRPESGALVFCKPDGSPMSPDSLSKAWRLAVKLLGLPKVTFHALRHTHASALIAAGLDVVKISRRLGHSDPTVTLRIYAHLFDNSDAAAAAAIEAAMRTHPQR